MPSQRSPRCNRLAALLALVGSLAGLGQVQAQPTITSTVPANGASGVSTATTVTFTFSAAMDITATAVIFYDSTPTYYGVTPSWNAGTNVLTCTPLSAWPSNTTITWTVYGQGADGQPLGGNTAGTFTTGTGGGGGGGSGTNAITSFWVGKIHHYNQTSTGSPTLDPTNSYGFSGSTTLSSNRTATNVVLTLPTASVSNLTPNPLHPEMYYLIDSKTNLSTYDATFPAGSYSFQVQAVSSNQTVVVNLPITNIMAQPGAPHVTNYAAAQTVDPSQPFVLGWDAFTGGTAADYIDVDIGITNYGSPDPGLPGALTGTARTFTIPAGTLQPNTIYPSQVGFFHRVGATNASFSTNAYRATYTEFTLVTSVTGPLVLTNAAYAPGSFSFDVLCTPGQTVTVEYKTNLATGSWQTLLTTNNVVSNRFRAVAPQAVSNRFLFFRARNGS